MSNFSVKPPKDPIKTVYQGTCPKLSAGGVGDLSYELGTDEAGNGHIRISANAGGGAFSNEWVPILGIRAALISSPFTSMVLKDLFQQRSATTTATSRWC